MEKCDKLSTRLHQGNSKISGRSPGFHDINGMLLSSKTYFFAAFHLAPNGGEPEIFTASKPFAIFSKNFFADSDSRVRRHGYHSYSRATATIFCMFIEQLFLYILICEAFFQHERFIFYNFFCCSRYQFRHMADLPVKGLRDSDCSQYL